MTNQPNRKIVVLGLVALIVLVSGFVLYKTPLFFSETFTVHAGAFRLEVPYSALLEGVRKEDIKVAKYEVFSEKGAEPQLIYELLPDGLTLLEPATFTLKTATESETEFEIPLLTHETGEGEDTESEVIDKTLVSFDRGEKMLSVSGEITHFSRIRYNLGGHFKVTLTSPSTKHKVGESFPFSFSVKPTDKTLRFQEIYYPENGQPSVTKDYNEYSYVFGKLWGIKGWVTTDYSRVLSPHEQEILDRRGLTIAQSYDITETFTCESSGGDSISTSANYDRSVELSYTVRERSVNLGPYGDVLDEKERDEEQTIYIRAEEEHECIAEEKGKEQVQPAKGEYRLIVPYTVICPGGTYLSGMKKLDKNGNPVRDALGNEIDDDTGRSLVCPGGT